MNPGPKTIEELVERYQPEVEKIFGVQLGKVEVKDYFQLCLDMFGLYKEKGIEKSPEQMRKELQIDNTAFWVIQDKNVLYVNTVNKAIWEHAPFKIPDIAVVHELTHMMISKIVDMPIFIDHRSYEFSIYDMVSEGLAEYVALNFPGIYGGAIKPDERSVDLKPKIPYQAGYNFFKQVAKQLGKDKVVGVLQKPPLMLEIFFPDSYVRRIMEERK